MAEEVTKKIIEIEVQGEQTVKGLKEEIASLRDKLLNVKEGSEDYKNVLGQLIEDEKQLTSVMAAGKKEVHAAAGSYNALQQEMTSLKKVWKEVQDEASRNEIGNKINEINNKLKEMDASVGDFHRSVGDYKNSFVDASKVILGNLDQISPALGNIGGQISSLIPLIQKTVQTATKGLTGIKAAIAGTGIGLLVTALGLLVQNWDKVTAAIRKFIPAIRESDEATKAQVEDNEKLLAANKETTEQMNHQARLMQAQGKSAKEIIEFKKKETEALLINTQAQIEENKAKIQSIKEHSAFYRFLHGENKQLRDLEESMKTLVAEQDNLTASLKKLDQDLEVEGIVGDKKTNEVVDKEKEMLQKLLDELDDYGKSELQKLTEQHNKRMALLKKHGADTTKEMEWFRDQIKAIFKNIDKDTDASIEKLFADNQKAVDDSIKEDSEELTDSIQAELDEANEAFIKKLIEQKTEEERLLEERKNAYFRLAGAVGSVMSSIADGWQSAVQAQLDAGEISEEEAERQFEQIKAIQTAEAIINTIAGAVGAFMGITKDTGGWGIAAAIAEAVAVMAAGMAQVQKIQSTQIGTKSVSNQIGNAAVSPQTEYTPTYYQNITNATETENLANAISQQPIWVSVKDIDKAQKRVTVVQNESTF